MLERFDAILEEPVEDSVFPTYFKTVIDIRDAISSNTASLKDIADIIQLEPMISVKLLRLANSVAYSNGHGEITTLIQAIQRLGLSTVRRAVLTVSTQLLQKTDEMIDCADDSRVVWLNSIYMAAAASVLSESTKAVKSDEAFFRAITLNLGIFYLLGKITKEPLLRYRLNDLIPLIKETYLDKTVEILELFGISVEPVQEFRAQIEQGQFAEHPATIADILSSSYLYGAASFNWLEETMTVEHIRNGHCCCSSIKKKYDELRSVLV